MASPVVHTAPGECRRELWRAAGDSVQSASSMDHRTAAWTGHNPAPDPIACCVRENKKRRAPTTKSSTPRKPTGTTTRAVPLTAVSLSRAGGGAHEDPQ